METIKTAHGDVPLDKLVHLYELYKVQEDKKAAKRLAFLQTDEGKAYNRSRSKAYYEKNKEMVREKNKARYQAKKAAKETQPSQETQPSG